MAIVKAGYVVFDGINKYEAGMTIPASILKKVLENQSWKVINEKQEETKENQKTATDFNNGQEKEIEDIINNRMLSSTKIKKKGK